MRALRLATVSGRSHKLTVNSQVRDVVVTLTAVTLASLPESSRGSFFWLTSDSESADVLLTVGRVAQRSLVRLVVGSYVKGGEPCERAGFKDEL